MLIYKYKYFFICFKNDFIIYIFYYVERLAFSNYIPISIYKVINLNIYESQNRSLIRKRIILKIYGRKGNEKIVNIF